MRGNSGARNSIGHSQTIQAKRTRLQGRSRRTVRFAGPWFSGPAARAVLSAPRAVEKMKFRKCASIFFLFFLILLPLLLGNGEATPPHSVRRNSFRIAAPREYPLTRARYVYVLFLFVPSVLPYSFSSISRRVDKSCWKPRVFRIRFCFRADVQAVPFIYIIYGKYCAYASMEETGLRPRRICCRRRGIFPKLPNSSVTDRKDNH